MDPIVIVSIAAKSFMIGTNYLIHHKYSIGKKIIYVFFLVTYSHTCHPSTQFDGKRVVLIKRAAVSITWGVPRGWVAALREIFI